MVDDPPAVVAKPKSEGNEGRKVGGCNERLGLVRVSENPVQVLHGRIEGLDVSEHRWEAESKAGECEQEVGREGEGEPPRSRRRE